MRMRSRLVSVAALCLASVALAACGTTPPAPRPQPTTTPATLAPGQDPLPAHDTPIAQAPAALAAVWKPYGVSVIPGHDSLDVPASPAAANDTHGLLDDAQVAAIGAAVRRDQVLAAWTDENDQVSLLPRVAAEPFILGPVGVALAEGTHVHTPPCGVLPTEIGVHAPDAAVQSLLGAASNASVDASAVLVEMSFDGPCAITGTTRDGHTVTITTLPAARILVAAQLRSDPLLGTIAYPEAAGLCSDPRFSGACG